MALHKSAWDGLTIVVFDNEPQTSMQIEQSIAISVPWLETKIESFESYDDALLHCRDRRDVGLVILNDLCGQHAAEEVFKNLAAPFESAMGWPAGGVLTYRGQPAIEGFKALSTESRFIDYMDKTSLLDLNSIPVIIEKLWHAHTRKVESVLFPEGLQKFIVALAEQSGLDQTSQSFIHRTQNRLSSELNISWYDSISLNWAHAFASIHASFPKVLDANKRVSRLVSSVSDYLLNANLSGTIPDSITSICANKTVPLSGRLAICVALLDESRKRGELIECLNELDTKGTPGAPALLRHISRNKPIINKFASEAGGNHESNPQTFERVS